MARVDWKQFELIQGWLTPQEGELLIKYCVSPWLEIGTWKGKSTYLLGTTGEGTTIDWFKGSNEGAQLPYELPELEEVEKTLSGLPVTIINSDSKQVSWKNNISFLFLDGDHTYCGVRTDYDKFSPYLSRKGYLALHDVAVKNRDPYPGVTTLYNQLLTEGWELVERENRLVILRRKQ